jgi:hypothetical protein
MTGGLSFLRENLFSREKRFFWVTSLLFLGLFFSVYSGSLNSPWERDEGEYAYAAWLMDQGIAPYENSFLQKPPMIIYTFWLAHKINPEAFWPPRLLALFFIFFTILLAGYIAKKEFGKKVGYITLWLLIPMLALPYLTPFAANTERFMLLPLLGVLALYLNREKSAKLIFWAGFLGTISLLYKPVVLLVLGYIIFFWLWDEYQEKKSLKNLFLSIGLCIAGSLMAAIIFLGYFIFSGNGKYLWECAFLFNKYYASQMDKYIPEAFFKYSVILFKNWWILFPFTLAALGMSFRRKWFYAGIILLSFVSVFSSPIGHYYFLLMPFWAIFLAVPFVKMSDAIMLNGQKKSWAMLNLLIFLTLGIMHANILPIFSYGPAENCLWVYGPNNPFLESPIMAEKIKKYSLPTDKIFVAGSEPQIYYYSKRKSVSRFAITYPLIIETPVREKYQQEAVAEIKKELPKLIVYSNREESGLINAESPRFFIDYLDDLLKNSYDLIGGYFWKSDLSGQWKDLPKDFMGKEKASLLLYKIREN